MRSSIITEEMAHIHKSCPKWKIIAVDPMNKVKFFFKQNIAIYKF